MSNLVYEDDPWKKPPSPSQSWGERHDPPFYYVILIVGLPIIFSLAILITRFNKMLYFSIVVVISLIITAVVLELTPKKYQIFNDKISIVRNWLPPFDIPFSNIESITETTWVRTWGLNFNIINSMNSDYILRITRKRGTKVHITPSDRPLFLEHLNKAIYDWKRSAARVGS
jgi:hypothetical protein